jgi:sugar lactone lactonase YvrE
MDYTAMVTTLAGSGAQGSADGTGTAASFNLPAGVAVDNGGNVYVADSDNNKIRKITPAGVVTTFAGSGAQGSADGTGTAASFNGPAGLAVDSGGNVYVADYANNKIRKITPLGAVTTLAGSGSIGSVDGAGTVASFYHPTGVAVDSIGNVYVADFNNQKIRKITSTGTVTTFAGSGVQGSADGTGTAVSFDMPLGVAVDSSGNVYVADYGNKKIRKITSTRVVTTLAGSGSSGSLDGVGTAASFNAPYDVEVDISGNVYAADFNNNKIRMVTTAGVVTTLAGSGSAGSIDGNGTLARFYAPKAVAIDNSGNLYIADTYNNRIRKITLFK